jgi:hypothetical protein
VVPNAIVEEQGQGVEEAPSVEERADKVLQNPHVIRALANLTPSQRSAVEEILVNPKVPAWLIQGQMRSCVYTYMPV